MIVLRIFILFIAGNFISLFSQQINEKSKFADELYLRAIQNINSGKFDLAIGQCDSAISLNPKPIAYPYEKALALYNKNKFDIAAKILDSLTGHEEVNPQIYQLLGNCYDAMNNSDKAFQTYQTGLSKFPKSGRLCYELGIFYLAQKQNREAVGSWESGISREPTFPNNYYILSKIYFNSGFSVWSVIYSEIFSNITENEFKVREMSNLLYYYYKKSFYFLKDSSITIQFTTSMITSPVKRPNKDLSFDMAYQCVMRDAATSILPADSNKFSIDVLYHIRKKFIELWFGEALEKTFPNVLFDWQKKLIDENIFEAYNYFLFSEASPDEFKKWLNDNQLKVNRFQSVFGKNMLKIDEKHFFSRH